MGQDRALQSFLPLCESLGSSTLAAPKALRGRSLAPEVRDGREAERPPTLPFDSPLAGQGERSDAAAGLSLDGLATCGTPRPMTSYLCSCDTLSLLTR